jgi:uncharacterized protein YbbC (DUF1343 family)
MKKLVFFVAFLHISALVFGQLQPGAECTDEYFPYLKGKKVALVVNNTSLVGSTHLADSMLSSGIQVQLIFAPEHGFRGLGLSRYQNGYSH